VGGALAQHAEETLGRIGEERTPIVRELFRNLVTSQGTRASREMEDLLSVFSNEEEKSSAEDVLRELISARLLTSYETSVEIIHESLLSAWPRLVQWRHQDEGRALLRDQLRQAAQAWQDRGRRDDLLWTGSSYRELALWKERYTGGLSATEQAFADAAARLAGKNRRRRRLAVAALVTASAAVAAVTSLLWQQARGEALRAEASKLLALAQVELETYPTAALAYATKSLELSDTPEARLFALRAIERGPLATLTPVLPSDGGAIAPPAFSPDGEWLALGAWKSASLFDRSGRTGPVLGDYQVVRDGVTVAFGARSDQLMTTGASPRDVRNRGIQGARDRGRLHDGHR
jgi:hypothetical protein